MKDVVVIGGGPSGLAVSSELAKKGYDVVLLERNDELGGLLQQCIHDGFGTDLFGESLSGPEFADIFISRVRGEDVDIKLEAYVRSVNKEEGLFNIVTVTPKSVEELEARSVVYAIGCRERNQFEIKIGGTRPSGVYTAGTVQRLINLYGILPGKDVVILGGGDVGMIVARHLFLEGVNSILMVYPEEFFSGLPRNAQQCILDFDIPYRPRTIVRDILGDKKVKAVELVDVDEDWEPIPGTEEIYHCDSVILSVGLVPYSEKLEDLGARVDKKTSGPMINEYFETTVDGAFSVGNLIQIFDYVDDAVKTSFTAAEGVERYLENESKKDLGIELKPGDNVRTVTPQRVDERTGEKFSVFFRPAIEKEDPKVEVMSKGEVLESCVKRYVSPSILEEISISKDILLGEEEVIIDVR